MEATILMKRAFEKYTHIIMLKWVGNIKIIILKRVECGYLNDGVGVVPGVSDTTLIIPNVAVPTVTFLTAVRGDFITRAIIIYSINIKIITEINNLKD